MSIKFDSSQHWYGRDGKPQHNADLRVARKEGLYPSVTSIEKHIFKNEFLDQWKVEQVVLAAAEHPRQPHEDTEAYSNRIYQLSLDKPREASDFGSAVHDAIERYPQSPTDGLLPWFNRYHEWHDQNVSEVNASELILVDHEIGVAGRCDRIVSLRTGERAVIDYKTQGVKRDAKTGQKKPAFYESWPRQLSFYSVADAKSSGTFPELAACISLVIDSDPDNPMVYEKVWAPSEIRHSYLQFLCGAWLWFSGNAKRKAYWPNGTPWFPSFSVPLP